jgi:hypothetical protein
VAIIALMALALLVGRIRGHGRRRRRPPMAHPLAPQPVASMESGSSDLRPPE